MNLRVLVCSASLALAVGAVAAGARAADAPLSAADALSYDDPGMHFKAPDGWTRIQLAEREDAGGDGGGAPAAAFGWHIGRADQRTILITIKPFSGTLSGLESQHESDLRTGSGSTFVDKRTQTTLPNGMPVYVVRTTGGSEAGKYVRRYDYLIFDGERGIDVAYIGRPDDFTENDVQASVASLYVVAYPRRRS